MNTNNLLTLFTTILSFGLQEVVKEAARQGKTPGELLDAALAQTQLNAQQLADLRTWLNATQPE